MEIYLIRHTTPLLTKGLIYGRLDVELTADFEAERDIVLGQLPRQLDIVYSSPSLRCTKLAASITPVYKEDAALYELDFGDWEGKTWDTINRAESEIWMKDFVRLSPPKGESMFEMQTRVMHFWNELLKKPYQKVAIVTHGGVIRIILASYKGVKLEDSFSIKVELAEVVRILTA